MHDWDFICTTKLLIWNYFDNWWREPFSARTESNRLKKWNIICLLVLRDYTTRQRQMLLLQIPLIWCWRCRMCHSSHRQCQSIDIMAGLQLQLVDSFDAISINLPSKLRKILSFIISKLLLNDILKISKNKM